MKKTFLLVAAILLLAAGCSKSGSNSNETVNTNTNVSTNTETSANVKSFTVVARNYSFAPATITVNKGDTVRITFQNSGGDHDFVLDEFNARTNVIHSGQSETVEFTADKAGSFEYYCSVGTHRQMGMRGTLMVQ